MSSNSMEYYQARAAAKRLLAENASHPAASAVHASLAERYEQLAVTPRRRTLHIVTG